MSSFPSPRSAPLSFVVGFSTRAGSGAGFALGVGFGAGFGGASFDGSAGGGLEGRADGGPPGAPGFFPKSGDLLAVIMIVFALSSAGGIDLPGSGGIVGALSTLRASAGCAGWRPTTVGFFWIGRI